jgi:PAS domain S-box-containing protein
MATEPSPSASRPSTTDSPHRGHRRAADPRQSASALAERVEFLEDVLRSLPVGLVVIDEATNIVLTNPLGDEIREVGDRLGRPLKECHPERTHEAVDEVFARLRDNPPDRDHPLVVERKHRWEVHYARISGRDGRFRGASWVAVDIRRQKELQRQVLHQERLAGLGRMAGRLAHEVKNSLNVVNGALHYLRRSARADPAAIEMVSIIDAQVGRLAQLIDHLREVTRPLEAKREPCDVRDVVAASLREFRLQHDCIVSLDLPPDLPRLRLDSVLLGRFLTNALDNAARAAGRGGTIEVVVRLETRGDGEWLVLEVADNGPGFAEEVLDHLFEPFVTTRPDGTGLGLVIMREVCRLHGGDLEVANRPEGGSRVTARLMCQ